MLTFVCWLWQGWRPVYGAAHVNTLARMLRANVSVQHKLICVTDSPTGINECETFPVWPAPQVKQTKPQNSYLRLRLFDPDFARQFGDNIISIDLDCAVLKNIDDLFTGDSFRAVRGECAPINGSMWQLPRGDHANVWRDFDPATSPQQIEAFQHNGKRIGGSDQAWMSMNIPNPRTWGPEDGVYQFSQLPQETPAAQCDGCARRLPRDKYNVHSVRRPDGIKWPHSVCTQERHALSRKKFIDSARIVFFAGHTKPWDLECKRVAPELHAAYLKHAKC